MPDPRQIPIGPSGTPPKRDLSGVPQPRSGLDTYGIPPPPPPGQPIAPPASAPLSDKSGKSGNKWKLPKRK